MLAHRLRVVRADEFNTPTELLIEGKTHPTSRIRVAFEERDISMPIVDTALHNFYKLGNGIAEVDDGRVGAAVGVDYIKNGKRHTMRCAAMPLVEGPQLLVPTGFFDRS